MQRLDQRKEQLVFSHAACSYYKWGCGFKSIFEGAIFAGRMRSAKTSKFKCLENKALYGKLSGMKTRKREEKSKRAAWDLNLQRTNCVDHLFTP